MDRDLASHESTAAAAARRVAYEQQRLAYQRDVMNRVTRLAARQRAEQAAAEKAGREAGGGGMRFNGPSGPGVDEQRGVDPKLAAAIEKAGLQVPKTAADVDKVAAQIQYGAVSRPVVRTLGNRDTGALEPTRDGTVYVPGDLPKVGDLTAGRADVDTTVDGAQSSAKVTGMTLDDPWTASRQRRDRVGAEAGADPWTLEHEADGLDDRRHTYEQKAKSAKKAARQTSGIPSLLYTVSAEISRSHAEASAHHAENLRQQAQTQRRQQQQAAPAEMAL
jgi:hypothetical protein